MGGGGGGGDLKGVSHVDGGSPLMQFGVSVTLLTQSDIMGVHVPCTMQWDRFVHPSCCQKRENTAFELVLWDFRVPVSKLLEVVLHVRKGSKFGK